MIKLVLALALGIGICPMKELTITLAADAVDAYEEGDTLEVALDGVVLAEAIDLRPGGDAYPGGSIGPIALGNGNHSVTATVRDALGNATEAIPTAANAATGPRPPSDLAFVSQAASAGAITFAFTRSPDVVAAEDGEYHLYVGTAAESIDFETVVGTAAGNATTITESEARPITDGTLYYAIRAANADAYEDEADPAVQVAVDLVAGEVQLPPPAQVGLWQIEPVAGGKIRLTAVVNNVGAAVPVAALNIYAGDGGEATLTVPVATIDNIGAGQQVYTEVFDPAFSSGTNVGIVLRAVSADGVEEDNEDNKAVVVDAQAPPDFMGVSVSID